MSPATRPRPRREGRLMVIHAQQKEWQPADFSSLPQWLHPGDLLVVNDAATFPASLFALCSQQIGHPGVEVRLANQIGDGRWQAILFGEGDWHRPTEARALPPSLRAGERIAFGGELSAVVEEVSAVSPRLVTIAFEAPVAAMWQAIYRLGRPVQYSYMESAIDLWDLQTVYGSRPWAAEIPSAGRPLDGALLESLTRGGIGLARLTHSTGLSSSGDPVLDAHLPFPERTLIPQSTVDALRHTLAQGGRVIAVGTSVARGLEGRARNGGLRAGEATTDLLLHRDYRRLVVGGILTGMHDLEESHFRLLESFADRELLLKVNSEADRLGFLKHEFGDSCLIL